MRSKKNLWRSLMVAAMLAMMTVPAFAAGEAAEGPSMYGTFWALIPPIVAIVLALITKQAYASLFLGVVVGGLFVCDFAPVATLDTVLNQGLVDSIAGNAGIFLILVLLGILFFIDDYFNCLTVGSVMKPVTDSH